MSALVLKAARYCVAAAGASSPRQDDRGSKTSCNFFTPSCARRFSATRMARSESSRGEDYAVLGLTADRVTSAHALQE